VGHDHQRSWPISFLDADVNTKKNQSQNSRLKIFRPNRQFRRSYDRVFRRDPRAANLFLLLAEVADERGQVETDPAELARLMAARFEDPTSYNLGDER